MSFRITVDKCTEWCDVCDIRNGGESYPARPFITIRQKDKGRDVQRNYICAHLDCLERKIAKAKKQYEKQSNETGHS
jgi:hypothetical protein